MITTDFLGALGVGASFNTKEIVKALVDAEQAPQESRINAKISESEAQISGLAALKSSLSLLQTAATALNDVEDFDKYTASNSQTTALSVLAGSGAAEGAHSVTVNSVARSQTMNLTQNGGSVFTSKSQILNSGSPFSLSVQIGGGSGATHTIEVSTATPQGIANAFNNMDIGISAQLIDQGTSGTNYIVQLTGQSGSAKSFTVSESGTSLLNSDIPSGFSAADASLSVNGLAFTRATNQITDILPGVTLNLNSATSGAASISLNRDTTDIESNIKNFVAQYNDTKAVIDTLTSREEDGDLAGNTTINSLSRTLRNVLTNVSSTPGDTITRLTDIGVEINKTGTFDVDEAKLRESLSLNMSEVAKILSANTNSQTDAGVAARGIAGDISKIVSDFHGSGGYFTTKTAALNNDIAGYNIQLTELDDRMANLKERYDKQFLAMQRVIDEMNNTKDNLISTFENLPFTSDK